MIGEQHHDRVGIKPGLVQRANERTDLIVDVGNSAQIRAPRGSHLRFRGRLLAEPDHMAQAA